MTSWPGRLDHRSEARLRIREQPFRRFAPTFRFAVRSSQPFYGCLSASSAPSSIGQPPCVLLTIVGEVLPRFERLPPAAVGSVPLDGLGQPLLEVPLRPPAE